MTDANGATLLNALTTVFSGLRGRVAADAPMSDLTWLQVGGPAQILFQPADEADLADMLRKLPSDIPVMVVGVGSNLLVRDGGVAGVVVRLSAKGFGQTRKLTGTRIEAGAACPDKRLSAAAHLAGIGGFHFYHGIPGTVGGALRMNAGANGSETAERVIEIHALDRGGNSHVLSRGDMDYAYRHSGAAADLIFTRAVFEGYPEEQEAIRARMEDVQTHRESVQPVREKTGGSTFKNPPDSSAWKVIDEAGCRGLMIGGAQMSPMHCNFMINTGPATAYDLETLGETVRARVLEHSGIRLEWEIKRIGRFRDGQVVQPFLGRML